MEWDFGVIFMDNGDYQNIGRQDTNGTVAMCIKSDKIPKKENTTVDTPSGFIEYKVHNNSDRFDSV